MISRGPRAFVGRRALRAVVPLVVATLVVYTSPAAGTPPAHAERRFTAMTYNLYLGANLQPLFGLPFGPALFAAAGQVYAHVVQTDFPARAEAIAELIAETSPDVIGLQEVALWQTASLTPPGPLVPTYDFLAILLQALEDIGHPYEVVAVNTNFGGALPIDFPPTTLASFTDRDVIIVRGDLPTSELKLSNPTSQNFAATLPVPLGGGVVQVPRGWSTVDIKIRGKSYRFVNTHLEAFSPVVRNLQAMELAASLAASPYPVVLAGDINSLPTDIAGAYGIFAAAGLVDGWTEAMPGDPGFTAGQTDDLDDPSELDHRVDYVLHDEDGYVDGVAGSGEVVGEEVADRTATVPPLWPSDHAGIVLTLHIATP